MTSNNGLIGFPSGNALLDGVSVGSFAGAVTGADTHFINVPLSPDALASGVFFRYTPVTLNSGPVAVFLNGAGPFDLRKCVRTQSGESVVALLPLAAGDLLPGATLVCMMRAGGIVEVLSGITVQSGNVGLDVLNASSQAAARTALGLASGATTTVGTAATRNIGTAAGQVPQVVDGSGNLDSGINVANHSLDNLSAPGIARTVWSAISFTGAGSVIDSFNGSTVARNSTGLYTIGFPAIAGSYNALIAMDVTPDSSGTNSNVVSGTRTTSTVQISCRKGNSSVDPFDPDRVTVSIFSVA